jgi:hypothetical protein
MAMSLEATHKSIISLINKWNDPNNGATTEELEQLDRALELAIDDVKETIRARKEDAGEGESYQVIERLEKWKKISDMRDEPDDHTRCPECRDQLYFCGCTGVIADELLLNHYDWILNKVKEG